MVGTWSPDDPVGPQEWKPCRLCGRVAEDVRVALGGIRRDARTKAEARAQGVKYPESPDFRAFPRCPDRDECRWRREAQGKEWPLVDGSQPRRPADADVYLASLGLPVHADPGPFVSPDDGRTLLAVEVLSGLEVEESEPLEVLEPVAEEAHPWLA